MSDYNNIVLHESFLKLALNQKNLPFASQQYRQILEVTPGDEVANQMRNKIINLATFAFVPPKRTTEPRKRVSLPVVVSFLGLFLAASGFVFEPLRSLIPIGAVFCAIGFAIIYYNKKQL